MNAPEKPIMQVMGAYKAAVNAKDVDGFVALYDPDVVVFDLWGQWSYQGIEAWRRTVVDWFGSLGADQVVVEWNDVQAITDADIAIVFALITYKAVSAEGKELRAMQNRLTWALGSRGGSWRILHEHTSAPADIETSKVILQRS